MGFAYDIESMPDVQLVAADFNPQIFVDVPLDTSKWKLQKTIDAKLAEYNTDEARAKRVAAHAAKETKRYEDILEKAALDASISRILCISYQFDEYGDPWNKEGASNVVEWGDEDRLLYDLWKRCEIVQRNSGKVFTCSSSQFDLYFCWRRTLAAGVLIPTSLRLIEMWKGRYSLADTFVDVAQTWAGGAYGCYTSVNRLARVFGVQPKADQDGVTGANFWKVYLEEGRDRVEPYALRDSAVVWEIAEKLIDMGIFKFQETHPK